MAKQGTMEKDQGDEVAARLAQDEASSSKAITSAAPGGLPDVVDFGDDAGVGMQNLDRDEYRIPFVRILDPKSPQCAPIQGGGLGARAGSLFNIATGELYDGEKGVDFIPCARDHNFVEWLKRNEDGSGGGFVAVHGVDDERILMLRAEQGRFKKLQTTTADGEAHEIAESFYLYGILISEDNTQSRVILGFSGMQCRKYTAFINRYDALKYQTSKGLQKPPLWAHRWHISTRFEKRASQSWYGWVITLAAKKPDGTEDAPLNSLLKMSDPLYIAGREFHALVTEGKLKADFGGNAAPEAAADDEVF